MIRSDKLDVVATLITEWIEEKAKAAGAKSLVFGLSGGADSALIAILCKRSTKFESLGVIMPCHSSKEAAGRAKELATKINLNVITVDLSKAHDLIASQTGEALIKQGIVNVKDNATEGALRSCLRAPTLDYVSKRVSGIIIGTGNRDEDEVTRYFQKRGDGCVDISPIAKLHKSEVYQLLRHLGCTDAIIDAIPTADLWGPDSGQTDEGQLGIAYPEVEWAIQLQDRVGGIFFDHLGYDQIPSAVLFNTTDRQRKVLQTLRHMEKISRHKAEMPPVFDLRSGANQHLFTEFDLGIPDLQTE